MLLYLMLRFISYSYYQTILLAFYHQNFSCIHIKYLIMLQKLIGSNDFAAGTLVYIPGQSYYV
jgi:hypothetical protein